MLWFYALTFAVTWSFWTAARAVVLAAVEPTAAVGSPSFLVLLYLGTFTPGFVALALTARAEGRAGVTSLLRRLIRVDVAGGWYGFAVLWFVAMKLASAGVFRMVTGAWPSFGATPLLLMLGATALSTLVLGQSGEELGWRGYALPRLGARIGVGRAAIVVGVLWASWHIPLFYVPGADTYGQSFPLYLVQVTGISVAIAWLWARTGGSLLLTMLMHAAVNNTKDIVPAVARPPMNPFLPTASPLGWIGAAVIWAAAACFLATMPTMESVAEA